MRASSRPNDANCALVVHTFWPFSVQVPFSFCRARVLGQPPEPRLDTGVPFSELRAKEKEAVAR